LVVFEGISRTEAVERYRRVGGLILSRLFVGSLGAGARPPINLNGNGGPEPEALLTSFRAAMKGLLPGCCEPDCAACGAGHRRTSGFARYWDPSEEAAMTLTILDPRAGQQGLIKATEFAEGRH
jgi:hypothetical protein